MPKNLAKYLPFLSDAERKELFGSITDVIKYPRGDPTREGVISGRFLLPPLSSWMFIFLSL